MTKNKDKILIIFGFLLILIYLLYYFDLYNTIINIILLFHNKKEGFNQMFRPNKIFKYDNKIFLLNTKDVLENGKNPLIFNDFNEYQNYILSLEDDFKKELKIYMDNKKININEIDNENEIKEIKLKKNPKKFEKDNKYPFFKDFDCSRKKVICESNEDTPFFESIYNPRLLTKFKEEQCKKFKLDEEICNKFKNSKDNNKAIELNEKCYNEKELPPMESTECKNHIFYQYNKDYVDSMCDSSNNTNFEAKCLLEDYFRENMLEFEL